jgi:hypothetical protein
MLLMSTSKILCCCGVEVWTGGGQSSAARYARASPQITVHDDGGRYDETRSWTRGITHDEMVEGLKMKNE